MFNATRVRHRPAWLAAALVSAAVALPASAQIRMPEPIVPDPNVPVKPGFDLDRAILSSGPTFQPMHDPEWVSLRSALRSDDVAEDTPMLLFEAGGRTLSLVTGQMSYHHVAQGEMAGEPWMVTF